MPSRGLAGTFSCTSSDPRDETQGLTTDRLGLLQIVRVTECHSDHTNVIETTSEGDSNGTPAESKTCSAPHILTRQDNTLRDPHKIALENGRERETVALSHGARVPQLGHQVQPKHQTATERRKLSTATCCAEPSKGSLHRHSLKVSTDLCLRLASFNRNLSSKKASTPQSWIGDEKPRPRHPAAAALPVTLERCSRHRTANISLTNTTNGGPTELSNESRTNSKDIYHSLHTPELAFSCHVLSTHDCPLLWS